MDDLPENEQRETSHRDHERAAERVGALGFAVLTFSDTRTPQTDASGAVIRQLVTEAGHRVVRYAVVPDDAACVGEALRKALADGQVDVVVSSGGTGISRRDCAHRVVSELLDERLDGFGELFRFLSFQQIGSAAMLSRAVGGVASGKLVFAVPGSTAAVRLALQELILPQVRHLFRELHKE